MFTAFLVMQSKPAIKGSVSDQLAAAKAIATYELAWWRKNHPKADLSLTFADPTITPAQIALVRTRLGFKDPIPVLDPHVLTMVLGHADKAKKNRMAAEAYVFLGSFPKGYRATYVIQTNGKEPKVLTRTVIQKYDQGMQQGPAGPGG